jgi:TolB-like protein/Flp pilus assembly protein TadD/tRNA A-37 threonylcarbamoyl transferase component Bud32
MNDPAVASLVAALAGRYRVSAPLGRGAAASVYLAEDLRHGRRVALKVLHDALGSAVGVERFQREIRVAARLQHPNILPLFDSGADAGLLWYTTPLVETGSLRDRLAERGPLAPAEAATLGAELAGALAHAHAAGIVHRDIKPENVLIGAGGHALLADFGIAGALDPVTSGERSLTETGIAVGTPLYMSPEQATGSGGYDGRSDIYALGAVLFEALSGKPPFDGDNVREVLVRRLVEDAPSVRRLRPEVPAWLDRVVQRAMARERAARYANAAQLADALAEGQRGGEAEGRGKHRRLARIGMGLVVGAVMAVLALFITGVADCPSALQPLCPSPPPLRPSAAQPIRPIVAVLPFKSLGPPAEQYFADGLTEEITSRLAGVGGLRVISRTSAEQYRASAKPLREIGAALGATYVLEGSVRWERADTGPGRVRVTPQLIRVSDDTHLWADRIDAEAAAVFALQSHIAERVAGALDVALGAPERGGLATGGTGHPEAYELYLRGNALIRSSSDRAEIAEAVRLYQRAIALDPGFALAVARLGRAFAIQYWLYHDHSDERLAAAKRLADSALALVPGLPEGRLALGLYYYWGFFDYAKALEQLELARAAQPSNSYILAVMAYIRRRQGKWEEAAALMEEALRLDPLMDARAFDLGDIYMRMRRYADAERAFDRAIALGPDWANTRAYKAMLYVVWQGDLDRARAVYRDALARIPPARLFGQAFTAERISGAVVTADSALRLQLEAVTAATFAGDSGRYHLLKAEAGWFGGDSAARFAHADSGCRSIEAAFARAPRDARLLSRLGVIYSFLGRHEDAIRTGRRAMELLPVSRDADSGPFLVSNLARSFMLAGQGDSAVSLLRSLLTVSSWVTPAELRADPTWAPLRRHPRFQELTAADATDP